MTPGYDGVTNIRTTTDWRAIRTNCAEEGGCFLLPTSERGRICVLTEYDLRMHNQGGVMHERNVIHSLQDGEKQTWYVLYTTCTNAAAQFSMNTTCVYAPRSLTR